MLPWPLRQYLQVLQAILGSYDDSIPHTMLTYACTYTIDISQSFMPCDHRVRASRDGGINAHLSRKIPVILSLTLTSPAPGEGTGIVFISMDQRLLKVGSLH